MIANQPAGASRAALLFLALSLAAGSAPASSRFAGSAPGLQGVPAPEGWWERALEGIQQAEYRFRREGDAALAPNRAQDLRVAIDGAGLRVTPRRSTAGGPAFALELSTVALGRGAERIDLEEGRLSTTGARAELAHDGGLVEWFENGEPGLEHGWRLDARPEIGGTGPLWLQVEVRGGLRPALLAGAGSRDAAFVDGTGAVRLRYVGLHAWDATGERLSARLAVDGEDLRVVVEDAHARYPITIDPTLTGPVWTVEGNQAGARMATSVSAAGDVDGDGFGDVLVGAPDFDAGEPDEGLAFVFFGSATGPAAAAGWSAQVDVASAGFGASVQCAGDVNADGYDDIIVGAPGYASGEADEGAAFVFLGSPAGPSLAPDWSVESNQVGAALGTTCGTAGDVNGDGSDDIFVGAPLQDDDQVDEGRTSVFHGGPFGPSFAPDWEVDGDLDGALFGAAAATAGDVDGDGFADLIVGAPGTSAPQVDEGAARVFRGSVNGLALLPSWNVEGGIAGVRFGAAVGPAGDVNGDGYADVLVGAPDLSAPEVEEGAAIVYLGSALGLSTSAAWLVQGDQAGAHFGATVFTAGDVNGDGYADVLVGAPDEDDDQVDEGRVRLYPGSATGPVVAPTFVASGDQAGARLGASLCSVGDVNGDGFGDVVVGAPEFDNGFGASAGEVRVYVGGPDGLDAAPAWTADGGESGSLFGLALSAAGDVNGDGFGDVVVGAFLHDGDQATEGRAYGFYGSAAGPSVVPDWVVESDQTGSRFGFSVAGAGDVNCDGYGDVLVGAPSYTDSVSTEGAVFLYAGSAAGLGTTPLWSAASGQSDAGFGTAVDGAGDVNGDGFADVLVTAETFDGPEVNEGAAFVFHGSITGPSTTADWSAESDQAGALLGFSGGTAGDVNGDGYSDVIVGAIEYDGGLPGQGAAFVWFGSAVGLSSSADWTALVGQSDANLGYSCGTAGDVNGDGYADVIVGARNVDAGQVNEGAAFAWYGSSTGPTVGSFDWSAFGDQDFASFGIRVSAAGDVNGDGYGDVLVGAHEFDDPEVNEGQALAYYGSPAGLDTAPAWTFQADQAGAGVGLGVSTAGDVNGDGFGDVLVGAYLYTGAIANEGRAFLFSGGGAGAPRSVQQRYVGSTQRIDHLGGASGSFDVRLRVATPSGAGGTAAGRERVRLQWELEAVPATFDGAGIGGAPVGADSGDPGTVSELQATLAPLASGTTAKWRARLAIDNPFFPFTPWTSLPGSTVEEGKVRGLDDCDGDGVPDSCEEDCDGDGVPDGCDTEPDCDGDGTPDDCDPDPDCDMNGEPDSCEISMGAADCNGNGVLDECELAGGDCDANGIPDDCDPDCDGNGTPDACEPDCDGDGVGDPCEPDCDGDGIPDDCDTEPDCDGDGVPDDCDAEPDCDANGVPDNCDVAGGAPDCDANGVPDVCQLAGNDCDANGIPDQCDPDCNANGTPDACDVAGGAPDCDGNGVPDECDPDCDGDGIPDGCEGQPDCDGNGVPDDCDLAGGAPDCNGSGVPDACELAGNDCDGNGVPDECDPDCDGDGIPDACEGQPDCDGNGVPDDCDIAGGVPDCNGSGVPDACELAGNDCDGNGVPDECDPDCDGDGIPDACEGQPDCDGNGVPDDCDLSGGAPDCNGNSVPDACDIASGTSADGNGNGVPDECEPGLTTPFCFGVSCPCGNDDPNAGCLHSGGVGSLLAGVGGSTSYAADDLRLDATCPPGNSGLILVNTQGDPPLALFDGLNCVRGGPRVAPGADNGMPQPFGDVDLVAGDGVRNFGDTGPGPGFYGIVEQTFPGAIVPGSTYSAQYWFRDVLCGPPPSPCPTPCGLGANFSNGVMFTVTP